METRATGWVWDERYGWHDTGTLVGGLPSGGSLQQYAHTGHERVVIDAAVTPAVQAHREDPALEGSS